jgi:7,8-dihydropterin-6-yl-methyl-4-(beta-D-ribofuranosyl)aminobenzene 5'-phosphate synthase
MSHPPVQLLQADSAQVLVLMDNYIDLLLPGDDRIKRPGLAKDGQIPSTTLLAEHGLSLLITINRGADSSQVLLDAGYTQVGVPHNLDMLGIELSGVEAVVLSHGHMDHFGSLAEVLRRVGRPVPLVVHPAALEGERYRKNPEGQIDKFPVLPVDTLTQAGAELTYAEEPYEATSRLWAASGGVERTTGFEKGMPGAFKLINGNKEPDPLLDDMAIVIDLKDKGLAVMSGCAHSGIVNTVSHATQITGRDRIHAVIGGFHLSGAAFEPIIGRTVDELLAWQPEVVMPMHCTGRKAQAELERALGPAYVVASVGAELSL